MSFVQAGEDVALTVSVSLQEAASGFCSIQRLTFSTNDPELKA